MDNNPSNGVGIALMWPVYDGLFSPFNLLTLEPGAGWGRPLAMFRYMLPVILYEIPFYILAAYFFVTDKKPLSMPEQG